MYQPDHERFSLLIFEAFHHMLTSVSLAPILNKCQSGANALDLRKGVDLEQYGDRNDTFYKEQFDSLLCGSIIFDKLNHSLLFWLS